AIEPGRKQVEYWLLVGIGARRIAPVKRQSQGSQALVFELAENTRQTRRVRWSAFHEIGFAGDQAPRFGGQAGFDDRDWLSLLIEEEQNETLAGSCRIARENAEERSRV